MRVLSVVGCVVIASSAFAGEGVHWGYEGEAGPEAWARLDPAFAACSGKNQSPIDLTGMIEADLDPIEFAYEAGGGEILNNGHTVQVNYAPGSTIQVDGRTFELKQFHFHAPSENHVDGKSFPMEAHFVHADKDGNLAVVALLFTEGAANTALPAAWAKMPKAAGEKNALPEPFAAESLLPSRRDYFRFSGSLTTPPCTEGVRWLVLKKPASVSRAQVAAFAAALPHPNNRPVQPVNARPVLK